MLSLLPEQTHYADKGCSVAPACLACPLERCRYEEPVARDRTRTRAKERNALIRELKAQGLTVQEISNRVGINLRSVFRILSQ